jgi:hypothetical protein
MKRGSRVPDVWKTSGQEKYRTRLFNGEIFGRCRLDFCFPVVLAETQIKENVIEGAVHTFLLLIGVCVCVCVCARAQNRKQNTSICQNVSLGWNGRDVKLTTTLSSAECMVLYLQCPHVPWWRARRLRLPLSSRCRTERYGLSETDGNILTLSTTCVSDHAGYCLPDTLLCRQVFYYRLH